MTAGLARVARSFLALLAFAAPAFAASPNFVVIFVDNLGMHDLSCYGGEFPTPRMDELAREGMRFTRWYSASPICTPSRFSLMTGRYPNRSHDRLLGALMPTKEADERRGIRSDETTIAQVLQQRGCHTAIIGKWHLGHGQPEFLPTRHGFDSFYGFTAGCIDYFRFLYGNRPMFYRDERIVEETGYCTDRLADEAAAFLAEQRPGQPFYLYLPFNAPHYGKGWDAEKREIVSLLQSDPKQRARVPEKIDDPMRREYAAMVLSLDDAVGRVIDALDLVKLREQTVVFFISDNGAMTEWGGSNQPFRGRISDPFEGGIRVPAFVRWPGQIKAGQISDQPCSTLDVFPTICRLAEAPTDGMRLDGRDISPTLLRGDRFERDLFFEVGGAAQGRALIRGEWKYVHTKKDGEMLFNLSADPGEQHNLAAERPGLLAELQAAHAKMLASMTP